MRDSWTNSLTVRAELIPRSLDLTLPLKGSIDITLLPWSTNLLDQYIKPIDVFSKYDNLLAFNVGNEVLTADATDAAPFIKAYQGVFVRDRHRRRLVYSPWPIISHATRRERDEHRYSWLE
ncbi:hypothetical protein B0H12DRAFT_1230839 [Mycena haematopus]|nr:hypothetical protein B0H12DRAFT_1230839 [Mycena haematopus]